MTERVSWPSEPGFDLAPVFPMWWHVRAQVPAFDPIETKKRKRCGSWSCSNDAVVRTWIGRWSCAPCLLVPVCYDKRGR